MLPFHDTIQLILHCNLLNLYTPLNIFHNVLSLKYHHISIGDAECVVSVCSIGNTDLKALLSHTESISDCIYSLCFADFMFSSSLVINLPHSLVILLCTKKLCKTKQKCTWFLYLSLQNCES